MTPRVSSETVGPDAGGEPGLGAFAPRGDPDAPRRSIPALVVAAVVTVALLAGTWLAGGFEVATGRLARLPVGTEVDLGPMSVAVDRALARERSGSWSVYVFARCRNNGDDPLESSKDRLVRNGFSLQHPVSREIAPDASLFFGPGETIGNSTVLNPGTPMVPCTLVFDLDAFPGTDVVSVGASELEWIDASPTGEGQMVWSASRTGYRFEVPVVTEPDR